MIYQFLSALLALLLTVSSSSATAAQRDIHHALQGQREETPAAFKTAQDYLSEMTLEEKVGQLFLIRIESLGTDLTVAEVHHGSKYGTLEWTEELTKALEHYPAGGFVLFGKNISDPEQLWALTAAIEEASPCPALISIDEEGGRVARIGNNQQFDVPHYQSMEAIGASGDPSQAKAAGLAIGSYLKEYGIHLDFAPVADVNTNPYNVVIGDRAFGSNPESVSQMVSAAIDGFHEAGIMTCIKHFPGHGDTQDDTHAGSVVLNKSWEELLSCELIPFMDALPDTDMVMVSHISLPNVTSDGLPASLSRELLEGKLRRELGYEGIIITDSMAMGAITDHYTSAESAVLALQAGADIILMPEDYRAAYEGVLQAVQEGAITVERLDESVLRILELKIEYGLLTL